MTAVATMTKKVMIIETSEQDAQAGARSLSQVEGAEIALLTPSTSLAMERIEKESPFLVVIDEKVIGWQGFCQKITQGYGVKAAVTADQQNVAVQSDAKQAGASAVLTKPLYEMQDDLQSLFAEKAKEPEISWEPQEFSMTSLFQAQPNEIQEPSQGNTAGYGNPFTQNQSTRQPNQQLSQQGPLIHPMINQQQMGSQSGMQMFNQAPPRPKIIVTVYSPKGGVGKTTMSLNLAVALRKLSVKHLGHTNAFNVGLVDFDVDFGDVAASLQLVPRGNVVDWPKDEHFDPQYVQGLFTFHPPSNVAILAGPERPEMEFLLDEEQSEYVIKGMHSLFDIVVVDMGYSLRKSSFLAMSMATHPLFVTTPDTPAVRDMTRAKKSLEEHNIDLSRSKLIVNKVPKKGKPPLSPQEVKRYIDMPVAGEVQEDPKVMESLSEGTPLTLKGNSPAATAIEDIAFDLIREYLPEEDHKKSFISRLFGGR